MFKNVFQGGPFVEVFSAQGRDPLSKWRLNGSAAIRKVYEKDVKSYVYYLEGETTTTKITLPKDDKLSLSLIQRYLVFQVYVPLGHSFSLEFGISDIRNNKLRISLSSSLREVIINPLHARFPLSILRLGVWLDLCLDLSSLVGEAFKGQTFKAVESLTISANCRLRRIFTMKSQPPDTTDDDEIYGCGNTNDVELEDVPKNLQLSTASEVLHHTQVINMSKIHGADARAKEAAGLAPPPTPGFSETETGAKEEQPTHIAFGSKVVIPPHARKSSREGSSGSAGGRSSREGSGRSFGLQHSSSVPHLRSNSPSTEMETSRESGRQSHRLPYQRSVSEATSSDSPKPQLGVEATQTAIQPRPPRTGSGSKTRRRPVRVRDSNSAKGHGSTSSRKAEVNKNCVDESDSCPESISRSQSESSLKMSGNEGTLSESFNQLSMRKTDRKDCQVTEKSVKAKERDSSNHDGAAENHVGISTKKDGVVEVKSKENNDVKANGHAPTPKISQESMFTFSSRPRSAPRSPRTRRKSKSQNPENAPEIQVTRESTESESGSVGLSRGRKESERSEYEEDFHRASGESSEDDDLQKFLKSSSNSRSSSRGSRRSPLPSTSSSGEVLQVAPSPHCLRTSIKSSLLKEIPSPLKSKSYDAKNYQSVASSWRNFQSSTSSWRLDTSMNSSILNQSLNSSFGQDGIIKEHFNESSEFEEGIINNDGGESLSDSSDDTSYSTWKHPPPLDSKQHCYADEMRHPGPEPDLTATLPLDPRVYTNVFSPPIILPSEKISSAGTYNPLSTALSPPRSRNPSSSMEPDTSNEDELDLLYDPCLNCYFDPRSCKYYELA